MPDGVLIGAYGAQSALGASQTCKMILSRRAGKATGLVAVACVNLTIRLTSREYAKGGIGARYDHME